MHGAASFAHCVNIIIYTSWQLPVAEFSSSESSAILVASAGMSVPDQPGTATAVVSKGKCRRQSNTLLNISTGHESISATIAESNRGRLVSRFYGIL